MGPATLELVQTVAMSRGEQAGKLMECVTLRARYGSCRAGVHEGGEIDHVG